MDRDNIVTWPCRGCAHGVSRYKKTRVMYSRHSSSLLLFSRMCFAIVREWRHAYTNDTTRYSSKFSSVKQNLFITFAIRYETRQAASSSIGINFPIKFDFHVRHKLIECFSAHSSFTVDDCGSNIYVLSMQARIFSFQFWFNYARRRNLRKNSSTPTQGCWTANSANKCQDDDDIQYKIHKSVSSPWKCRTFKTKSQ